MKSLRFYLTSICVLLLSSINAQITVNLEDQCNCEVLVSPTEVTAGATTPINADDGDLLVDPSGDLFYWDGSSWEPIAGTGTADNHLGDCLLYTSPSPRDLSTSRMPSSA